MSINQDDSIHQTYPEQTESHYLSKYAPAQEKIKYITVSEIEGHPEFNKPGPSSLKSEPVYEPVRMRPTSRANSEIVAPTQRTIQVGALALQEDIPEDDDGAWGPGEGPQEPEPRPPTSEPQRQEPLENNSDLLYSVNETPPWILNLVLGFQHVCTMIVGFLVAPALIASSCCIADDNLARTTLTSSVIFICGFVTLLQSTFGVRLPIVQGLSFAFIGPMMAVAKLTGPKCPTEWANATSTADDGLIAIGSPEHTQIWHEKISTVSGSLAVASLFEIIIGATGIPGLLSKIVGPITIAPVLILIGISVSFPAATLASSQWGIAFFTVVLVILFSQVLGRFSLPCVAICGYNRAAKGSHNPALTPSDRPSESQIHRLPSWAPKMLRGKPKPDSNANSTPGTPGCYFKCMSAKVFSLFPIIFAMAIMWIISWIITAAGGFASETNQPARTDFRTDAIIDAAWIRFPYPGQFGPLHVSIAGVIGMMASVLASLVESLGDYQACARLAGAPRPIPSHAVNRGILVEGFGCLIAGLWGLGSGVTSYTENIGAIGITKVGCRRVVQCGALIMIGFGLFPKLSALLVSIPDPIVGGLFFVSFGLITGAGISMLQQVDMTDNRNMLVVGISIFSGLTIPSWMTGPTKVIDTGSEVFDQVLTVLLGTHLVVGGFIACFLDNLLPAKSRASRGVGHQPGTLPSVSPDSHAEKRMRVTYDIPFISEKIRENEFSAKVPFLPGFVQHDCKSFSECCRRKNSEQRNSSQLGKSGATKPYENRGFQSSSSLQFRRPWSVSDREGIKIETPRLSLPTILPATGNLSRSSTPSSIAISRNPRGRNPPSIIPEESATPSRPDSILDSMEFADDIVKDPNNNNEELYKSTHSLNSQSSSYSVKTPDGKKETYIF